MGLPTQYTLLDTSKGDVLFNAAALAAIMAGNPAPVTITIPSATPASLHGQNVDITLTAATVAVANNSNIAANRGTITINTGTTLNSGYFYGAEGKVTCAGTIVLGSDYLTGVLGQINLTGATVTSGHIAAVIANIQGPVASAYVDGVYVESSGPAQINSMFKGIANTEFVLDVSVDSGSPVAYSETGTAGSTTGKGWLAVNVGGVTRYIPLSDSVS